jgi:hypothetical protein
VIAVSLDLGRRPPHDAGTPDLERGTQDDPVFLYCPGARYAVFALEA